VIADHVGRALPPSRPYHVGREKVREFALAVGEGALVCTDLDAARAAGHPDLVAPPTFPVTFTLPQMEEFLRDPAVGWDYGRMVHAEQSFVAHRPLHAGDEVVSTLHVDDLVSRAGSLLLTLRSEVTDTAGDPVVTAVSVMVTAAGRESDTAAGRESDAAAGRESDAAAGRESDAAAGRESDAAAGRESDPAPPA
jgi:acyl dehydratase